MILTKRKNASESRCYKTHTNL